MKKKKVPLQRGSLIAAIRIKEKSRFMVCAGQIYCDPQFLLVKVKKLEVQVYNQGASCW